MLLWALWFGSEQQAKVPARRELALGRRYIRGLNRWSELEQGNRAGAHLLAVLALNAPSSPTFPLCALICPVPAFSDAIHAEPHNASLGADSGLGFQYASPVG